MMDSNTINRRTVLKSGLFLAATAGLVLPPTMAEATQTGREVAFQNVHTGDEFRGEYYYNGRYLPDAFREIKSVMRDHRTNDIFPIDPRLLDIMFVLQQRLKKGQPFEVYSGYRSPKTNAMLRRLSFGVAEHSLHMNGQAVDLSLPGVKLNYLYKTAARLDAGGVGFYPDSNFIHLDTGRVRQW